MDASLPVTMTISEMKTAFSYVVEKKIREWIEEETLRPLGLARPGRGAAYHLSYQAAFAAVVGHHVLNHGLDNLMAARVVRFLAQEDLDAQFAAREFFLVCTTRHLNLCSEKSAILARCNPLATVINLYAAFKSFRQGLAGTLKDGTRRRQQPLAEVA